MIPIFNLDFALSVYEFRYLLIGIIPIAANGNLSSTFLSPEKAGPNSLRRIQRS